jgi:hypothetical protein
MVVETSGPLEEAGEFRAAGAHVVDVGAGRFVPVLESSLLLCLSPKSLIHPVGIEGRVDVDEIDALGGQAGKLVDVVAAVDGLRVEGG